MYGGYVLMHYKDERSSAMKGRINLETCTDIRRVRRESLKQREAERERERDREREREKLLNLLYYSVAFYQNMGPS